MRLKCANCGWMGGYMEAKTALRLSQSATPCPNCGQALIVHFDSEGEQRRFEDAQVGGNP